MKRNLYIFLTILIHVILVGCMSESINPREAAIELVNEKTVRDVNSLNIGYPLNLVGTGGGINHDTGKLRKLNLAFELDHPLSKDFCRWLIIEIATLFVKNINEGLAEFLPIEGFTHKNIDVSVFLSTPKRSFLYYPDIGTVSLWEGRIRYAKDDPKDVDGKPRPYIEVIQEPYEEALKIVEAQGRPDELNGKSF